MGLLLELLLWFILDIALEIVGEIILSLTRVLNEEEAAWPVAIVWFIVIGLVLGAGSTFIATERVLQKGPFLGVTLVVVPALLGAVMETWGRVRTSRNHTISHLATWYGGASMGLGLAGGRLGVLMLMKAL